MRPALLITALTASALAVHGYHPYGEDGGLYVAGVKKLLDPALYPHDSAFVTAHLRYSLFAPLVVALVRLTHLGLEPVLFVLYLAGIAGTLAAGWMLLRRIGASERACAGGTTLLACWLCLPIAGTSQMLMDPYLTARTFTTPLTLLAACWALDCAGERRHAALLAATLLAAALLHPLMAGYGLAVVAAVFCTASARPAIRSRGPWVLLALALAAAAALQLRAPAESPNYVRVAMTRYYWFPFRWEWYEQLGLVAPLAVLAFLGTTRKDTRTSAEAPHFRQALVHATLLLAGISLAVAVAFCRARLATHLVARMQPLRTYGFVYEVMTLLLGAWLAERVLKARAGRWALLLTLFGALFFYVQRSTYPASAHLELPGRAARNPYVQAFLWARHNTPKDALFALDAHYITRDGEDAQPFRALAERSALPDYSKDGGEASITPPLTEAWVRGQAAQADLDARTDAERMRSLHPLGVSWIVLANGTSTAWPCPYRNATVKVCQVP